MARMPKKQLSTLFEGYGYTVYWVDGNASKHAAMHREFASVLDKCLKQIEDIQKKARSKRGLKEIPAWPMIILRTPKGWTGPRELDGQVVEGTFRAHQVPASNAVKDPKHLKALEDWLKSYRP